VSLKIGERVRVFGYSPTTGGLMQGEIMLVESREDEFGVVTVRDTDGCLIEVHWRQCVRFVKKRRRWRMEMREGNKLSVFGPELAPGATLEVVEESKEAA
jgi:hypothetical protein